MGHRGPRLDRAFVIPMNPGMMTPSRQIGRHRAGSRIDRLRSAFALGRFTLRYVTGLLFLCVTLFALPPVPVQASHAESVVDAPHPLKRNEAMRQLRAAEVSLLRDPDGRLTYEQVRDPRRASSFEPLDGGLSLGYSNDALWLRINLQRAPDAGSRWRLELAATLFNDIRFYFDSPDGGVTVQQAGDQFPFAERPVAYRRPVFDLDLPDDQRRSFYVRIETDSTILAQLVLWQPAAFDAALQQDTLWIGGLLGIILISVLFFLYAWFLNRDQLLFAAAGVTIAFAVAAASNLGLLSQYLFPWHPRWAEGLHPTSMAVLFALLVALFARALDVSQLYPWFHQIRGAAAVLCGLAAASRVFDWYGTLGGRLMMAGMLIGLGWITAAAWLVWYRRRRGLLTAISLTVFAGSFAIAPMIALGWLPAARFFELFWVIGSVGFILLAQLTTIAEVRSVRIQRRIAERDATEALERARLEADWRMEQRNYFAGVAHDIRTPLNSITVGLANLRRALDPAPDSISERLDRLQSTARRTGLMIERHLQMLRLQHPGFELMIAPTPIKTCLDHVRVSIGEIWSDRVFHFEIRSDAPPRIEMDLELVVRALTNLLSNAARAAPPDTNVELEVVRALDGGVGFVVRDHGPGFPPDVVDAFRERQWTRLPMRSTPGVGDLRFGVGLPMTDRIAELHGGRLDYTRDPSGCTTLSLWLPGRAKPDQPVRF